MKIPVTYKICMRKEMNWYILHMNKQNVEHVGDTAHNQLLHIQTDENTQRNNWVWAKENYWYPNPPLPQNFKIQTNRQQQQKT